MCTRSRHRCPTSRTRAAALLFINFSAAGCSFSTQVTTTPRSSNEQRLLVRSLERSFARLDVTRLGGQRIELDVYGLTGDRDFARELLAANLGERGVRIADRTEKADVNVKVFINALGVDQDNSLIDIPPFTAPLIGAPVPEVALFKAVRNRGHAELQLFIFDESSGHFVEKSATAVGTARYDQYTVLILISFNLSDLDETLGSEER